MSAAELVARGLELREERRREQEAKERARQEERNRRRPELSEKVKALWELDVQERFEQCLMENFIYGEDPADYPQVFRFVYASWAVAYPEEKNPTRERLTAWVRERHEISRERGR